MTLPMSPTLADLRIDLSTKNAIVAPTVEAPEEKVPLAEVPMVEVTVSATSGGVAMVDVGVPISSPALLRSAASSLQPAPPEGQGGPSSSESPQRGSRLGAVRKAKASLGGAALTSQSLDKVASIAREKRTAAEEKAAAKAAEAERKLREAAEAAAEAAQRREEQARDEAEQRATAAAAVAAQLALKEADEMRNMALATQARAEANAAAETARANEAAERAEAVAAAAAAAVASPAAAADGASGYNGRMERMRQAENAAMAAREAAVAAAASQAAKAAAEVEAAAKAAAVVARVAEELTAANAKAAAAALKATHAEAAEAQAAKVARTAKAAAEADATAARKAAQEAARAREAETTAEAKAEAAEAQRTHELARRAEASASAAQAQAQAQAMASAMQQQQQQSTAQQQQGAAAATAAAAAAVAAAAAGQQDALAQHAAHQAAQLAQMQSTVLASQQQAVASAAEMAATMAAQQVARLQHEFVAAEARRQALEEKQRTLQEKMARSEQEATEARQSREQLSMELRTARIEAAENAGDAAAALETLRSEMSEGQQRVTTASREQRERFNSQLMLFQEEQDDLRREVCDTRQLRADMRHRFGKANVVIAQVSAADAWQGRMEELCIGGKGDAARLQLEAMQTGMRERSHEAAHEHAERAQRARVLAHTERAAREADELAARKRAQWGAQRQQEVLRAERLRVECDASRARAKREAAAAARLRATMSSPSPPAERTSGRRSPTLPHAGIHIQASGPASSLPPLVSAAMVSPAHSPVDQTTRALHSASSPQLTVLVRGGVSAGDSWGGGGGGVGRRREGGRICIEDTTATAIAMSVEAGAAAQAGTRPAGERVDAAARRATSGHALRAAELGALRGHVAELEIAAQRQRDAMVAAACAAATAISTDATGRRIPTKRAPKRRGGGADAGVPRGGGAGHQLSRGAHGSSREASRMATRERECMSSPPTGCTSDLVGGTVYTSSEPQSTGRLWSSSGPTTQAWPPPSPTLPDFDTGPSPVGRWSACPGTRATTAAGPLQTPSTPCAGHAYRLEQARLNSLDRSSPRARSPLRSPLSSPMTPAAVASRRSSSSRARSGPGVGLLAPAQQSAAELKVLKLNPSHPEVLPQLRHSAYDYNEFETAQRQAIRSPAQTFVYYDMSFV